MINLKDGEKCILNIIRVTFHPFFFIRSTDNFKKASSCSEFFLNALKKPFSLLKI